MKSFKKWIWGLGIAVYCILGGIAMRDLVISAPKVTTTASTAKVSKKKHGHIKKGHPLTTNDAGISSSTVDLLKTALSVSVTLDRFYSGEISQSVARLSLRHDLNTLATLKATPLAKSVHNAIRLGEISLAKKSQRPLALAALAAIVSAKSSSTSTSSQ
jgi:hypothetical protein